MGGPWQWPMTGRSCAVGPRAARVWLDGRRRWWIGRRHVAILTCSSGLTFTASVYSTAASFDANRFKWCPSSVRLFSYFPTSDAFFLTAETDSARPLPAPRPPHHGNVAVRAPARARDDGASRCARCRCVAERASALKARVLRARAWNRIWCGLSVGQSSTVAIPRRALCIPNLSTANLWSSLAFRTGSSLSVVMHTNT